LTVSVPASPDASSAGASDDGPAQAVSSSAKAAIDAASTPRFLKVMIILCKSSLVRKRAAAHAAADRSSVTDVA
jgi:hypothetical protein